MDLTLSADGSTSPLAGPPQTGACTSWNVLQVDDGSGSRLLSDLGELIPAHLTSGRPAAPREATGAANLRGWAPFACSLASVRSQGVRSVRLAVRAAVAARRERLGDLGVHPRRHLTGGGTRVLAQFRTPGGTYGAVAAKAENPPRADPATHTRASRTVTTRLRCRPSRASSPPAPRAS